jgi:hypothetical protein
MIVLLDGNHGSRLGIIGGYFSLLLFGSVSGDRERNQGTMLPLTILGWILAAGGWMGFLFPEKGFHVAIKKNEHLAAFGLAVVLSDGFRTALRAGYMRAVGEHVASGSQEQAIARGLIKAVCKAAEDYADPEPGLPSTISIITAELAAAANPRPEG